MLTAKSPDTSRILHRTKWYKIYDAYPTKAGAESGAKDIRTLSGRVDMKNYTIAVTVDLGKGAGRLRYGLFIAKGRPV